MAGEKERSLLIFDLDETLIHAVEEPLESAPNFCIENHLIYQRPCLIEFLNQCGTVFDIAIWSSGSSEYVNAIVSKLFPQDKPVFVWARDRCAERRDPETDVTFFKKDLKKVTRHGYPLSRIIIVEDNRINVQGQYGNAVYIKPFQGELSDTELQKLLPFLLGLASSSDVRSIEKRNWGQRR